MTKVAVVTGAAGGIGAAIVGSLQRDGWRVAGLDLRPSPADLDLVVDLADADALRRALDTVAAELGSPTGLVNGAGLYQAVDLLQTTPEYVDAVLAVNVAAPIYLCRGLIKRCLDADQPASIVNIASIVGHTGSDDPAYGASKGALFSLTKGLAKAYGAAGIRVNAVAPGVIEPTPMAATIPEHRRRRHLDAIPEQRFGRPEEVAEAVAYLMSSRSAYINGAILDVNGGLH
ncbi:SDR family NAD(P)-dependent oxidoreductase [Kribbella deserti]|uniref:SDR family NAD(P)-dependent oxidoreductase n=1 Tax=Kribbella deserti TaxID=1926257 RepID=A0ABV6QQN5_9ACTN